MKGSDILNRRMVLEDASRVADGAGGFVESWAALGEIWASVTHGTGRIDDAGRVARAEVPLRIRVRALPEGAAQRPAPGQRLREGGRVYRILAVAEADRAGRFLTCYAREEASA